MLKKSLVIAIFYFCFAPVFGQTDTQNEIDRHPITNNSTSISFLLSLLGEQLQDISRQESQFAGEERLKVSSQVILTQQLLEEYSYQVGKTKLSDLNISQKNLLLNAAQKFETSQIPTADLIALLGSQVDLALAPTIKSFSSPRVINVSPLTYTESNGENTNVTFTFSGKNMNLGKPKLEFQSSSDCKLEENENEKLTFNCEFNKLQLLSEQDFPSSIKRRSGRLTVFEKQIKKGFLGLKRSAKIPVYRDIIAWEIPNIIGSYTLEANLIKTKEKIEREDRSQVFSHKNNYCEKGGIVDWIIKAQTTEGWFIDEATVRMDIISRSSNTFPPKLTPSKEKIFVQAAVYNRGECRSLRPKNIFAGNEKLKDIRGEIAFLVKWQEVRAGTITEPKLISRGFLDRNINLDLALPKDSNGFNLTVKLIDGKEHLISSSSAYDWGKVTYSQSERQVTITPINEKE